MKLEYTTTMYGSLKSRPVWEVQVMQPCGTLEISFWDRHPSEEERNAITCQCTDCKAMAADARHQR